MADNKEDFEGFDEGIAPPVQMELSNSEPRASRLGSGMKTSTTPNTLDDQAAKDLEQLTFAFQNRETSTTDSPMQSPTPNISEEAQNTKEYKPQLMTTPQNAITNDPTQDQARARATSDSMVTSSSKKK